MGDDYTLQPEARGGRNRGATKKKAEPAEQIRGAVRRLWVSASEEEVATALESTPRYDIHWCKHLLHQQGKGVGLRLISSSCMWLEG